MNGGSSPWARLMGLGKDKTGKRNTALKGVRDYLVSRLHSRNRARYQGAGQPPALLVLDSSYGFLPFFAFKLCQITDVQPISTKFCKKPE